MPLLRTPTTQRSLLLRETMSVLESRLDPQRFFRTHRSAIVQLDRVRELKWPLNGEGIVILQNGTRVRLARGRRDALTRAMQSNQVHAPLPR